MNLTQQEAFQIQLGVIADALSILMVKRRDYSGTVDPFGNLRTAEVLDIHPVVGTFNRMLDKIVRVKTMIGEGTLKRGGAVGESAADAFRDIINYDCIAAGLVAEEVPELYEHWMALGERFQDILEDVERGFLFEESQPASLAEASCAFGCADCAERDLGVQCCDGVEIDQAANLYPFAEDLTTLLAQFGCTPTWHLAVRPELYRPE
ncbi:hypothetical protein [Aggregatilinea lenta]|uniref:hypothetical protein n=1 Tax=Aggregatilinea lenta TaxID=913108 RepID=UPI000E5B817C|nr:hypothetical protein [Aggregatilinea lenta]